MSILNKIFVLNIIIYSILLLDFTIIAYNIIRHISKISPIFNIIFNISHIISILDMFINEK